MLNQYDDENFIFQKLQKTKIGLLSALYPPGEG